MYSASTLSGTESSSFWSYWDMLRNRMGELIAVGPRINALWQEAKDAKARTTDPAVQDQLADQLYRLSDMYTTWESVQDKITEWGGMWSQIASSDGSQTNELGLLPLALPAWAIASLAAGGLAAMAFVATHGLDLLKQYQSEQQILAALKSGDITEDTAVKMYDSMQPISGGFLDTFGGGFGEGIGTGMGSSIPWIIGIGALLYFGPQLLSRYGR